MRSLRLVTIDSWRYINILYTCMYVCKFMLEFRCNFTVYEIFKVE